MRYPVELDITQSAGNYTLAITKAEWAIPNQLESSIYQKGLWIHYKVTARNGFPADTGPNPQQFLQSRIYSPTHFDPTVQTTDMVTASLPLSTLLVRLTTLISY